MTNQARAICELCREAMPSGEEMFKYHGYSGPCPKAPLSPGYAEQVVARLIVGIGTMSTSEAVAIVQSALDAAEQRGLEERLTLPGSAERSLQSAADASGAESTAALTNPAEQRGAARVTWQLIETAKEGEELLLYFPADERHRLAEMIQYGPFPPHFPRKPTLYQRIAPPSPESSTQEGSAE